jgi:hypothetical protein
MSSRVNGLRRASVVLPSREEEMKDYTLRTPITDIALRCRDDVVLYFSKYLLAIRSKLMEAPLLGDSNASELPINDYDSTVVRVALHAMEAGWVPKLEYPELRELYKLAHQWDFSGLDHYTAAELARQPTWEILNDLKQRNSIFYHLAIQKIGKQRSPELPAVVLDLMRAGRDEVRGELATARRLFLTFQAAYLRDIGYRFKDGVTTEALEALATFHQG